MRDIVFRGKRIDGKGWVEGDLIRSEGRTYCGVFAETLAQISPETVGQYSGMKDKNGVRIFEGDIVRARIEGNAAHRGFEWPLQKCVFRDGAFGLASEVRETVYNFTPLTGFSHVVMFEVIGNVYDMPGEV